MKYRIEVDYYYTEQDGKPIYKDFDDANKANEFIQEFLRNTEYGVVGVRMITPEMIEMYFDIV